jgi:predicted regulator of Ras-like GTPase activity (Roadblock/LC7/MglB family)
LELSNRGTQGVLNDIQQLTGNIRMIMVANSNVNNVTNENKETLEPRPNGSLIISEDDGRRIRKQLDRMLMESGASTTLLLDKSGEVISARGEQLPKDLDVMGALLAGTFATSREIARMREENEFRTLYQQGSQENTLTELVGESWLIAVIFGKSTHVGLVRDLTRQITPEVEAVLLQVQRRSRNMSGLNPSFRTSVEDTIDLLFKD